ncbi:MAG: UvrB/UvrC motif-containing protein [Prevotella sp.]|jgi:hypothetical protein
MNKTRLILKGTGKLEGSEDLYLVFLTDAAKTRQLTMTCDRYSNHELGMRLTQQSVVSRCLPEALMQMLRYAGRENFEIFFYGVNEGQYDCMLFDMDSLDTVALRASDGVLLSVATGIPLYIDTELFRRQSTPLAKDGSASIAMPANIASEEMLRVALKNAVEKEDYELASQLRDELNRRKRIQGKDQ